MLIDAHRSQLLLIDLQAKLMPAISGAEEVLANARRLAQAARLIGVPTWGTEQNPERLGQNDAQLREACKRTLPKLWFSACDENLLGWLRPAHPPVGPTTPCLFGELPQPAACGNGERNMLVIAGCEAHVGVLQTALGLLDDEFEVWVVTDACGARTERDRDAAYDRLAGVGVELVTTEMVAFEWLGGSRHPAYQKVLALLR